MSKNYFVLERKKNKDQLLAMVKKNSDLAIPDGGISYKQLRALFSLRTGLSFKKIDEYLEELLATELIIIEEGFVKMAAPSND